MADFTYGQRLAFLIDAAYAHQEAEDGMRTHLGASIVGRKCMREVWYAFRWFDREPFEGRMLRLFNRGHKEETMFIELLRRVGAEVWSPKELKRGEQNPFLVSWLGGHFGGEPDGVARRLPDLPPDQCVLLECKTHNDKRFQELKKKGLREAQDKHFKQAQVYMHGLGLTKCLYCAVNKNDDELWFDLFDYDPQVFHHLHMRGESIVFGEGIPPRISNQPGWFECRFCAMKDVCFHGKEPMLNCRTCVHSRPERDGTWSCAKGRSEIKTHPKQGCGEHVFIR